MTDFYSLLEVPRDADDDAIKKAFRKAALKYHPDKAGDSAEAAAMYERCSRAQEVLLDQTQREIYDKFGETGLNSLNAMGPEFAAFMDPKTLPAINWILFAISMGICCFITAPALLAVRIDQGTLSYTIALSPLFLVDFFVYVALIISMIIGTMYYEGESTTELLRNLLFKFLAFFYFGLLGSFEVLLAIQLDQVVDFSWWGVFSPLLVWEGFNFLFILIPTIFECLKNVFEQDGQEGRRHTVTEMILIIVSNYYFFVFRFVQTVLIIYKVCGATNTKWALVLLPLWLFGFIEFAKVVLAYFQPPKQPGGWRMHAFGFVVWSTLVFSFAGLLVTRLDNSSNSPPVATILAPLFLVLSVLLCCFGCIFPCAISAQKHQFDEEMMFAHAAEGNELRTIVAVDHRIEV